MKSISNPKNNALNNVLEPNPENSPKVYPIKEFLIKHSRLLNASEKEQEQLLDYRDKVFARIITEIRKYYRRTIKGDYHYDGMPEIKRGIRGWMETKIWRLLVSIGEPHHRRHQEKEEDYWAEEK